MYYYCVQPSIDELSPSKLPSTELATYANDLETLILKIRNLGLQTSDILQRCVNLIRDGLVTIEQVGEKASKLRAAFIEVQARRNLTRGINDLVIGIEEVRKVSNLTKHTCLTTSVQNRKCLGHICFV